MLYSKQRMTQNSVVIIWFTLILLAAALFYLSLFFRYEPSEKEESPVLRQLFPVSEKTETSPQSF